MHRAGATEIIIIGSRLIEGDSDQYERNVI